MADHIRMRRLLACVTLVTSAGLWVGCGTSGGDVGFGPGVAGGAGGAGTGGESGGAGTAGTAGTAGGGTAGSGATGGGGTSAGGAGVGGTTAGTSGAGGGTQDAGPDVDFNYDGGPDPIPDACASETIVPDPLPIALNFVLDKSGSMTGTKWNQTKAAVSAFVNDPSNAGDYVAVGYFNGTSCSPVNPSVNMGQLPGHASAITTNMNANSPTGYTPTQAGLQGGINYCKSYMSNPSSPAGIKCVVILMSDGLPEGANCSTTSANGLQSIAATGLSGTPSVQTFTVGMPGASFGVLNAIAAGGGTDCMNGSNRACDASNTQAFINALNTIKKAALSCEYAMPTTSMGIPDPSTVEVNYAPMGSGNPMPLPKQPNAGSCGSGWFFDDPINPTKITLCPNTCDQVKNDNQGVIAVEVKCEGS